MTEPLAKWLVKRYAVLWKRFKTNQFEFEEAKKVLDESNNKRLSVIISDFRKNGWMDVKLHPESSRKRLYTLKPPEQAILEIAEEQTN